MLRDLYHESTTTSNLPVDIEIAADGNVIFYDEVRQKKVSVARQNLTYFSHQRKLTQFKWLEFASRLPSNLNGFLFQRDATITTVSINIQSHAKSVLRIYLNDNNTSPIYTMNIINVKSMIEGDINIDVNQNDILKCQLEIINGKVDYPIINLEHAWRY